MAFGSASGPPASRKQIDYLTALLAERDFASFREARHPLGLTQRQASGKFTRTEASELIDRLLETPADEDIASATAAATASAAADRAEERLRREREAVLAGIPADVLAEELERRGWRCEAPA